MKDVSILKYEINPRLYDHFPLDWEKIFQRKAPLAVEVGCGNGEFLVNWAQSQPDWNFLGIELSLTSVERIQSRIFAHHLQHVRVLRDDARFVLSELFADFSITRLVMNFPDPWPKKKHQERRLLNSSFVATLGAVLEIGGSFELFTDQQWYAAEAKEYFTANSLFRCGEIESDFKREISTKYERKWREQYRQIFHLKAIKKRHKSIVRLLENTDMPHVYIQRPIIPSEIENLKGIERINADRVFAIKEVFSTSDKQAFLLRIVTSDRNYVQNFFLLVARHGKGFIVKIDSGFQPYRTPAVKMAVEEISKILQSVS